jgi:predicted MarR family transcription regulator
MSKHASYHYRACLLLLFQYPVNFLTLFDSAHFAVGGSINSLPIEFYLLYASESAYGRRIIENMYSKLLLGFFLLGSKKNLALFNFHISDCEFFFM